MFTRYLRVLAGVAAILPGACAETATTSAPAIPATAAAATNAAPATTNKPVAANTAAVAISESDNGKTVALAGNGTLVVTLAGNPTTGYSWTLTKIVGTALEQAGEIQYVPTRVQPGIVGSGGSFVATFRALKAGTSTLSFGYARPWENGTPPVKSFEVTVTVDKMP